MTDAASRVRFMVAILLALLVSISFGVVAEEPNENGSASTVCSNPVTVSAVEFAIKVEETTIFLLAPLSSVTRILGEPIRIEQVEGSGGFERWVYDGLIIGVQPSIARIQLFVISSSEFSTAQGVTIGSHTADVTNAYGPATQSSRLSDWMLYESSSPLLDSDPEYSGYGVMGFQINDSGLVREIVMNVGVN